MYFLLAILANFIITITMCEKHNITYFLGGKFLNGFFLSVDFIIGFLMCYFYNIEFSIVVLVSEH